MQKSFALTATAVLFGLFALSFQIPATSALADLPLAPNTADASSTNATSTAAAAQDESVPVQTPAAQIQPQIAADDYPVELIIPAIHLDAPIVPVGVTQSDEMDVPPGNTNEVGWYKDGTVPGTLGSAVLDAHVFAEFKNLKNIPQYATIYVVMHSGAKLHFVAQTSDTYPLADVPLQQLFAADDQPRLNLITCAGNLTPDHSTYDHRLIVYATLKN